ncbi:uncharacterized protein LOC126739047 isoform X2 [Anthonomus grandis grandis]|uniref:uncharacterized protein LOC126739047 isoform X2 n=1 Tax=Anthonomus grandis grandis TaxID=2921223 RepID=UPI002165B3AC|nr:uncharacterized protein LOC126739047 isoform X2 [Anthonomus grandis grandis]
MHLFVGNFRFYFIVLTVKVLKMSRRSALILNMALKQADCEFGNHAKVVPSNSTEMDNVVQQQPSRQMINGKALPMNSMDSACTFKIINIELQQPLYNLIRPTSKIMYWVL